MYLISRIKPFIKFKNIIRIGLSTLAFSCFIAYQNSNLLHSKLSFQINQTLIQKSPQNYKNTILIPKQLPQQYLQILYKTLPKYSIVQSKKNHLKIVMVNQLGQSKTFDLPHKEQLYCIQQDWIHKIMNFNNPPQIIQKDQLKRMINKLEKDENILITYLPQQKQYENHIIGSVNSDYNRYSRGKLKNIAAIEKQFRQLKYQSSTNKSCYLIVKDQQLAKQLNLGFNNVGDYYFLRKTSNLTNNQSNFLFDKVRCLMHKIQGNVNNYNETIDFKFKKNMISNLSISYINEINLENDLINFLRIVKSNRKDVFLISMGEEKPQFIEKVQKILVDIKKTFKQEIIILITKNKGLIQKYFHIQPDDFITLRILNFNSPQIPYPIFKNFTFLFPIEMNKTKFCHRYKHKGAFKYDDLSIFIQGKKFEYYEQKTKLKTINTLLGKELNSINGLVIFQKNGCQGCEYYNSLLQQLQDSIDRNNSNEKQKQYNRKYEIKNLQKVKNIKIYRYNILNQYPGINPSGTTPEIYYFKQGNYVKYQINNSLTQPQEIIQGLFKFINRNLQS